MAANQINPIIKIKRGLVRPGNYTEQTINGILTISGLSAGELGINVTPTNYAFYVGNTFGVAITFGAEVSIDGALTSNSDSKIPTEKALKTYVDQRANQASGAAKATSRYSNEILILGSNIEGHQKFAIEEFNTGLVGTSPAELSYNTSTGEFSANTNLNVLVNYQIGWTGFSTSSAYNSRDIVRSAWIQRSGVSADNKFGFATLLCPPLAMTSAGAIQGVQNGSAIIPLTSGQTFAIKCKNHGSVQTSTTLSNLINPSGAGAINNISNITRVQITKL